MDSVFEKIIRTWYQVKDKPLNAQQLSVMLSRERLTKEDIQACLNTFSRYFRRAPQWRKEPDWQAIKRDFPSLFGVTTTSAEEIESAFADEKRSVAAQDKESWLDAEGLKQVSWSGEGFLYTSVIVLEDGAADPGKEGMDLDLYWPDRNVGRRGQLMSFDPSSSCINVKLSDGLERNLLGCRFKLRSTPVDFLTGVQACFNQAILEQGSLARGLYERNEVPRLAAKPLRVATEQLNDSQSTALCRVFEQDATFIWGPPGTGKTYTLAKIIAQGMQHGMRILATGISNVAVDNLASALVKELRRSERGTRLLRERRLLRFGYPVKNEVVRNDDLYPNKERINELRKDLAAVVAELAEVTPSNAVRRSELNERRDQLRRTLKDLDKERVGSAQVVLTTSAMCFLNAAIVTADYDMVIVDEVSMMPLVQAIAMAAFTKDKLVIAGDFKQLGPICISRSEAAQKWFATDIFTYLRGSKEYEARGLVMLDEQRRMLEPICDLINERFYRGKLRTQVDRDNVTIPGLVRTADHPVTFISVVPGHSAGVQQFGSSRRNPATAEIVLRLADRILRSNGKAELGIIAPYNGQVSLYRERMLELKWSPARVDRIKLGTIHSFQGSEYEIIIWDVVDDRTMAVGQLYRNNGGERLVNVAISRARSKLFIVGDERLFSMAGMAHMASKHLVSLFNDLRMTSKSFVSHNKIWEGQRD